MIGQGIVFRSVEDEETPFQAIEVEGHLIDSMILSKILDAIMDQQGEFEYLELNAGKKKNDYNSTRARVSGETRKHLNYILGEYPWGPRSSMQPSLI